jgi:hypothetical protein
MRPGRMKILSAAALVLVLALALTATACSSGSSTAIPTAPSAPASIIETFNGTVTVGSSDFHNFAVTANGSVNVTLTAASPPATIWMGLGVGTPGSGACSLPPGGGNSVPTPAGVNPQLSGTLTAGTYCVLVYDIGNVTSPVTYSVTVAHS